MAHCLLCGEPDHQPPQACTACGSRLGPDDGFDSPASQHRYRQYLRDHYFHSQESALDAPVESPTPSEDIRARSRMRLSLAQSRAIDAQVRASLQAARPFMAVRLEFDANLVGALAREDTQLRFRLTNHSGIPVNASLYWDDPETAHEQDFLASTPVRIKPGGAGDIKGQVVFARAGRKSISEMYLCVEQFGETALMRLHPFDFFVGNPDATVINQYHTTNHVDVGMGAIVKGAEFGAAGAKSGPERDPEVPKWIPVSFSFVHDDEMAEPKVSQAARYLKHAAAAPAPVSGPAAAVSQTASLPAQAPPAEPAVAPIAKASPVTSPAHEVQSPPASIAVAEVEPPASPAGAASASAALPKTFDPGPFEYLETGARAVFEICGRYAGRRAISSLECSLPLLQAIFPWVPDPELSGIIGILVDDEDSITFDARRPKVVTGFEGAATVISADGVTRLEMDDGDLSLQSMDLWQQLPGLTLECQRFGPGAYILAFGDDSGPYPGCLFDQRHEPDDSIPAVCETVNRIIARLKQLQEAQAAEESAEEDEPDEASEPAQASSDRADPSNAAAWPFDRQDDPDSESSDDPDDDVDDDDAFDEADASDEDQAGASSTLIEAQARALQRFLSVFSLATQRCSEALPRSIYLASHVDDDLLFAAWESTQLSGSGIRAVCIDPAQGRFDDAGRLVGWTGPASLLSVEGIYHVMSAPDGQIRLDGTHCFLSWRRLFSELGADLYIRDLATDLWLGVADKYFFIGAFCDYSPAVTQWDYFEEFVKGELLASFEAFKEAVLSA